jgi:hypothetical protein
VKQPPLSSKPSATTGTTTTTTMGGGGNKYDIKLNEFESSIPVSAYEPPKPALPPKPAQSDFGFSSFTSATSPNNGFSSFNASSQYNNHTFAQQQQDFSSPNSGFNNSGFGAWNSAPQQQPSQQQVNVSPFGFDPFGSAKTGPSSMSSTFQHDFFASTPKISQPPSAPKSGSSLLDF